MNIELTDKAIQKLMEKTCDMGLSHAVRIGITGGGCGGFEYIFDFLEHQPAKDDDIVLDYGKFFIHIDPVSAPYLDGLTLDHTRNGLNEGFEFFNPNVKNTCGCGVSVTF
tara:strand:+ start:2085 stop:2414 length:330 start_codon:yes stop_codon:yes gene_type:complete